MSGYTPGPWRAVRNAHFWQIDPVNRRPEDPYSVGDVCSSAPEHPDGGVQEANAKLIAKAPAMHDALHSARHALANASMAAGEDEDGPMAKVVAEIDAALGGGE